MRVLVFPGGTEIALEIWAALRDCKEVELTSAGQDVPNHAPFVFPAYHLLPAVGEPGWLEALNALIVREKIDYVFPAHDEAIFALAGHLDTLRAPVIGSPARTCRITRFKSLTYEALRGAVAVPEVYPNPAAVDRFPVFCKPDRGQGSLRARRVDSAAELAATLQSGDLILEYLPGREYTVDCFSDRDRGLLFAGGRERTRVRNGISVSTHPVENPEFEAIARAISSRIELHGAWFFQVKEDREGRLKTLEVGPRIAGAMALNRVTGVNFPLLSIYEHRRMPVDILRLDASVRLDRALVNRYHHNLSFQTVYVDLDDTLILRGQINTRLVRFLYQCVNRGIRLVVLTRHAGDPRRTLAAHRLAGLFDEIVHVPPDGSKAAAIRDRPAIFIDDSFSERLRVYRETGVPAFDCSMIEMLLDERSPLP